MALQPEPSHILVVEDDPILCELLEMLLEGEGYRVETAQDGATALLRIEAGDLDLVLLDLMLPELNGLELCRRARARRTDIYLPIVMITALASEEQRQAGFDVGADDYITKPFSTDDVLARVKVWLRTRQRLVACYEMSTQLAAIADSSSEAIVGLTLDGRITSWNRAAERLCGYRAREVSGHSVAVILTPEQADELPGILERLRGGEQTENYETALVSKAGRTIDVSLSIAPIRKAQGVIAGGAIIARDIRERKRAEQALRDRETELRQAQKMEAIGRLAGGVAHDFNNLLTAINGYSELLLHELDTNDPHYDYVKEIAAAGERAGDLTRQLLAFSRRQVLVPEVLDLNGVVANMDKMLQRLIGEDIELVTLLQPELRSVKADRGQLEQVIVNLVVNARDAMPQGGRLTIETADVELDDAFGGHGVTIQPGQYALLAVTDTGRGMDRETQAHIFEPFFTTKEPGKGTGLGLSTVYGIVKQSGGYVWAYSEPGRGTTFKVYLPSVEEAVEASKVSTTPMAMPSGTETILLVEDEEQVRAMMRGVLQGCGYHVLEARRGDEALRIGAAYGGPIHLLLTDVVMPGMSGREVVARLAPRHPDMRVLYMSGYTDHTIVHHGVLEAGVSLLHKPFTLSALAQRVRQMLDEPQRAA